MLSRGRVATMMNGAFRNRDGREYVWFALLLLGSFPAILMLHVGNVQAC